MTPIKNVLIVGGGTAGWLTAGFLARTLGTAGHGSVAITVVESSDIGIIGVGEGTFPSIRGTLSALGIADKVSGKRYESLSRTELALRLTEDFGGDGSDYR